MKTFYLLFRINIIIFLFNSTLFSQLSLTVYTDKEVYNYGETIKLCAKVTNPADTTFEFLAGSYETCQAEFSFNDYNSWEYAACLPTAEMLTFKPHHSKIYSWKIEPQSLGLPNKEGTQTIIGNYYFDLADTIYIQAPKFLGGEVEVSYNMSNFDSISTISNNLNADVLYESEFNEIKVETWQIEGYDIDSLVQIYSNDSIFVSFQKSALIMYESIVDENPLDYYPLKIGNKWYYEKIELENLNDPIHNFIVTDTLFFEVLSDTLMPNGIKYFVLSENALGIGNYIYNGYDGIYYYKKEDSSDVLVFNYFANLDEYYSVSINNISRVSLFNTQKDIIFGDSIATLGFNADGLVSFYISFAEGLGPAYYSTSHQEPITYRLIGYNINDYSFGYSPIVGITKKGKLPVEFSLSQNYPNPFNPTTTIEYTIPDVATQNSLPIGRQVAQVTNLIIYDVLGREITTLVNKEQSPGKHQIVFDASNLSSGIYYYSLRINNQIISKKMIVLK